MIRNVLDRTSSARRTPMITREKTETTINKNTIVFGQGWLPKRDGQQQQQQRQTPTMFLPPIADETSRSAPSNNRLLYHKSALRVNSALPPSKTGKPLLPDRILTLSQSRPNTMHAFYQRHDLSTSGSKNRRYSTTNAINNNLKNYCLINAVMGPTDVQLQQVKGTGLHRYNTVIS